MNTSQGHFKRSVHKDRNVALLLFVCVHWIQAFCWGVSVVNVSWKSKSEVATIWDNSDKLSNNVNRKMSASLFVCEQGRLEGKSLDQIKPFHGIVWNGFSPENCVLCSAHRAITFRNRIRAISSLHSACKSLIRAKFMHHILRSFAFWRNDGFISLVTVLRLCAMVDSVMCTNLKLPKPLMQLWITITD